MSGDPEGIRVGTAFTIPDDELEWRFTGSGGPGGQHANTANTRVELVWDVSRSKVPSAAQRARLIEALGSPLRVVVTTSRSQHRNREAARRRLGDLVRDALVVPTPRRPTRATRASVERRLDSKRRRSELKSERRNPPNDHP